MVLRERKTSKHTSPYDPAPCKVIAVNVTQITAKRGQEIKKRDSQRFKKVKVENWTKVMEIQTLTVLSWHKKIY